MITDSAPAKRTRNEELKEGNPVLCGTISQTLADASQDCFSHDDYEFLKFHGVYQQDDRDKRKTGKHYMLMVRTKFPGGRLTAAQYAACDRLASSYGNNTLRITTRQDFQFHGILKSNLRQTIAELNQALVTTIAACGDVERNIMAPPTPATSPLVDRVAEEARRLSEALAPRTPAYHSIWLEGKELDLNSEANRGFVDPLYGKQYLPRKFKTAFAIPPLNDVDIYSNDLGFVAIAKGGELVGYNVLAGGGMGMSHGNAQTFPRLADDVGFVGPEQLEAVTKAVIGIHREFGDRTNRRHARLKYVIAERGLDWFKTELEARLGAPLAPPKPFAFTTQGDLLGWHQQTDGRYFLGLFVENGRVRDALGYGLKTALRQVAEQFVPEFRLTPSQNVLMVNLAAEAREVVTGVFRRHGISVRNAYSATRLAAMACPALPTCGLALAESERFLPTMLTGFEDLLAELGMDEEEIVLRMTGCPNGCARPYTAELAFVGRAPGRYQVYVGGSAAGTRLNRVYRDNVKETELLAELRPLFERYRQDRQTGERFGDWCARAVWS